MKQKKILFYIESSAQKGLGHYFRCLALAQELNKYEIHFISNERFPDLSNFFFAENVSFHNGKSENEIIELVKRECFDLIVIDKLEFPKEFVVYLKINFISKVLSFHELEISDNLSDITINYNTFKNFRKHTGDKESLSLLGPKYIIFRDEIRNSRRKVSSGDVENIFISMGGSDPNGLILVAMDGIESLNENINFVVHAGPSFLFGDELKTKIDRSNSRIKLIENVDKISEFILQADLGIISGGNTMYEMVFIGTPSIVIPQNQHQNEFAEELDKLGIVININPVNKSTPKDIKKKVLELINDKGMRNSMIVKGQTLIDGEGIFRIKKEIVDLIESRIN